jgi:hypothetical protein
MRNTEILLLLNLDLEQGNTRKSGRVESNRTRRINAEGFESDNNSEETSVEYPHLITRV